MSTSDEKPWILDFSYRMDPIQIDQEERDNLMKDLEEEAAGATLRDGSRVSLRNASIVANPHYVSPESIERGHKLRDMRNEFDFLKTEGQIETIEDYKKWKKESDKNMKRFEDSIKEENEKERTT